MATDLSTVRPEDGVQAHSSLVNGDATSSLIDNTEIATNQDSFVENGSLPTKETTINTKPGPDPNPAGPTPTEDVAGGIQPVADFVPKEAPTLSHPTPPPEEQLLTGEADVDTEMTNAEPTDADVQTEAQAEPQPESVQSTAAAEPVAPSAPAEPSLVRPREEDGEAEEERAAKRSRVEDFQPTPASSEIPAATSTVDGESIAQPQVTEAAPVVNSAENLSTPAVAPAEQTVPSADANVPAAPVSQDPVAPQADVVKAEAVNAVKAEEVTTQPSEQATGQSVQAEAKPSVEGGVAAAPAPAPAPAASGSSYQYSTAPMTALQKSALEAKAKNLKETKSSQFFLKPVDPVALNIPQYPEIIKKPMDLSTLESKLKKNDYPSVQAFADDFDLIIANCRKFNGEQHPVTHAAMALDAYFRKTMESLPSADQVAPEKAPKRASPAVKPPPRRESRAAVVAPAAGGDTFALQADGVPQIRRDSSLLNRPARAIKPPANREIPYAKPKRKEHQLELKFCEHVLDEIRGPQYGQVNHVFLMPVDPVALNIPHYRQVIKHPMDLGTMAQKLKQGQYGNAKEFKKDFDLVVDNCLLFNPQGNPVRDMGIQLRRHFEALWREKEKWERAHKPESQRATSDEESEGEEDEDDDDADDENVRKIKALQKQLADMQNALTGIAGGAKAGSGKSKKSKSKGAKAKIGSISSAVPKTARAPAPKSKKASKPKQVTYDEKQEISEAVGRMSTKQVEELTEIITSNVPKYRDQEEMELEIDELPNHVQIMLLKFVRRLFGRPKNAAALDADSPPDAGEVEDDDFEPERGARAGAGGKRKKHKPMGKREQAETINNLHKKLAQFGQVATSGSESPTASSYNARPAESSGDDESEESEEE